MNANATPKVRIGCHYSPVRYEVRSANEFRALRPDQSSDADALQGALLGIRRSAIRNPMEHPDAVVGLGIIAVSAVLAILIFAGVVS